MKKVFLFVSLAVAMGLASCSSVKHTATTVDVANRMCTTTTADLQVSPQKISYNFTPTNANRRAGEKAVLETAVAQALKANGNADVLVGFEYEIKKKRNKVMYVTVEGYPATYKNFTTVK